MTTKEHDLNQLAQWLEADLGEDFIGARLVHVMGKNVAVIDLGDEHPADILLGAVNGDIIEAMGVIAHGWGTTLNAKGAPKRVRIVQMLSRNGDAAQLFRIQGEPDLVVTIDPPLGRVPDYMRRAFDLPTPPPEDEVEMWEALRWAVVTGETDVPGIDSTVAAWMDTGVFSREYQAMLNP